jgi:hypothetical protein
MAHKTVLVLLLVALFVATGCAHQAGGIAPSTKPLEAGNYSTLGEVTGKDCVYALLGVLPFTSGNTTRRAMMNAIGSVEGADALVEVTADTYSQYFIILSRVCTQVQGTAVQTGA